MKERGYLGGTVGGLLLQPLNSNQDCWKTSCGDSHSLIWLLIQHLIILVIMIFVLCGQNSLWTFQLCCTVSRTMSVTKKWFKIWVTNNETDFPATTCGFWMLARKKSTITSHHQNQVQDLVCHFQIPRHQSQPIYTSSLWMMLKGVDSFPSWLELLHKLWKQDK